MASNRALLMSTLKKVLDAFPNDKLPLTGVMRLALPIPSFRTDEHITSHVLKTGVEEGLGIIQRLNEQREFLLQTGPLDEVLSPRTALAGWHLIQQKYSKHPFSPLTAALALEDAALHVHSIAAPPRATWWLEEDDPSQPLERAIACPTQLDHLAQGIRLGHPHAFPERNGSQPLALADERQMRAVADTLFASMRFRQEPIEWVYDGFKPLLLPDVVVSRKGMSVSLVTLVLCVMRRLGVTAIPSFSDHAGASQALSDHLAQIHLGRQLATTPAPVDIVLWGGSHKDPCILDPCAKRGQWLVHLNQAPQYAAFPPADEWSADLVFRLWAEHAKTMIVACQRRGQSDDVFNWMYQHAALDPLSASFPGVEAS